MGSGFQTFTAGSVLTASEVNNYLMEQSVMSFATTAARDSAITAPEAGMTAYINSGDSSEGLYSYTGTTWNKGSSWNAPWGFVALTSDTTSATITANTNHVATTFTAFANRYYKINFMGRMISASGNIINIYDSTAAANIQEWYSASATDFTVALQVVKTFTAGSRTIAIRTSSNVTNAVPSALHPYQLIIEDIGPSGAPN
jgi:hypothetical protein